MDEHPNAVVVRRAYEAYARDDAAELAALVDDAVVLRARTPLSISAVGDLVVVIEDAASDIAVVAFRVVGGRVVGARRLPKVRD
ncbi:MAG: hypothetical protein Q8K63_11070 [Acidimicrobiales bacterium]|nr:hypothetical protein [Acidimicrobiales bacterium]